MVWFTRVISIIIFTLCLGVQVVPEEVMACQEVDMADEISDHSSQLWSSSVVNGLPTAYDFLGKSFILTGQGDFSSDQESQKMKWHTSVERFSYRKVALKCPDVVGQEQFYEILFSKHIQGYYIYWIDGLIV